ncbi:MAG: hypothetical protein ACI9HX_001535 [Pseudoalteromonas tetraodonis]|jgi:uncharacterized protein YggE
MKSIVFASLIAAVSLSQASCASDAVRDVSVNGFGEISVAPDRASLSFAVEGRHKSLADARDQVSRVVAQTLAIADELGIERKYVVSSHSDIRPEYTHHYQTNERTFSGYFVNRQVSIYLQDVGLLGVVTEKLLDAGINNVSSPQFSHSQEEQLRRKALSAAAVDAKANAAAMAAALGNQIGQTLSISSNVQSQCPSPVQARMKMASASFAAGAPPAEGYAAGQIVISATVSASFELK